MSARLWLGLAGGVAAMGLLVHSCVRFVPGEPDRAAPLPGALAIPVENIRPGDLVDTFTQSRGAGGPHDAIDIIAARGTPVLAAAPGVVEKLFVSERGGKTIYIRSPDMRWIYYYAHLDRYRAGLAEGQRVQQGDVLGRVGSTGNADPSAPHLHFAINRMTAGETWYQGKPINPYPLLVRQ